MHSKLRPSPAMVIALIALFVSLGGTAAALSGSNTVFSDDIVDNQVRSADVRDDTLSGGGLSAADLRPSSVGTGEVAADTLAAGDLAPSSVGASEVASDSLTGLDINESLLGIVPNANQLDGMDSTAFLGANAQAADSNQLDGMDSTAFLDACPSGTSEFGPICARSGEGGLRAWITTLNICSGLGLRVPSTSEAVTLAQNHDVPGVSDGISFWTDDFFVSSSGVASAVTVREDGVVSATASTSTTLEDVCVADPSN